MSERFAGLLLALVVVAGCASGSKIAEPRGLDVPLPTGRLEDAGLDTLRLHTMLRQIPANGEHRLHSLLIVRHGKLVVERYFNGYTRHNPHDIRSATKSITALLTGIAIAQGALPGVDASVMDYLRASYPGIQGQDDLMVRHLLTMSTGLDCHDRDRRTRGQEDRMYRSKDWVRYFLELPRRYPPGDTTLYCTGGVVALGEVLAQALGEDVATFAERELFAPLGIANYTWARFDDGTKVDTGGHLLLTPQGLAKIGLIVLQEGQWEGHQIVPVDWIRQATAVQTYYDGSAYGFLWWRYPAQYGEKTVEVLSAHGNGGQVLFVVPEFDLVAVFTAGYYNSDKAQIPFQLFFNAILPAVDALQPFLPRD